VLLGVTNSVRNAPKESAQERYEKMSVSLSFRRVSTEDKPEQIAVAPESWMDKRARARGAALVESVIAATRRDA
jgi:hypothetical protein